VLHLRIITPPPTTQTVLRELDGDPGVTHITIDHGAWPRAGWAGSPRRTRPGSDR
jgi:hypothetical protein